MPAPLISKDEVLRRLTEAFRRVGYDGATLSLLAKETGLKKASLYHYFPGGKKEMAQAALTRVSEWFQKDIFAALAADGEPEERLKAMTLALQDFHESGRKWCLVDLFSLGEAGDNFRGLLRNSLETWINHLKQLGQQSGLSERLAEERAKEALISIQGGLVLSRVLEDTAPFEHVLAELPVKFLRGR